MRHTISVLVENEFGVLTRVAGLFSGRGFNIQSLTVAETLEPKISRMTIVTSGNDATLEQINKQLNKLVNVIKVMDVTGDNPINRILALLKVSINTKTRMEIIKTIELLGGEIIDSDGKSIILEVRGDEEKIRSAINLLNPYGIVDFVQTGNIALQKCRKISNPEEN